MKALLITLTFSGLMAGGFFFLAYAFWQRSVAEPELQNPNCRDLATLVDDALLAAGRNHFSVQRNTPWELVHALVGLGQEALVNDIGDDRLTIRQYFERGGPWHGESVFSSIMNGPGLKKSSHRGEFEGHPDQFLAYFGLAGIPIGTKLAADDGVFSVKEMIFEAKRRFHSEKESSFTLLALAIYEGYPCIWTNQFGQKFSLRNLAEMELAADTSRLSCGGTHSLLALTHAFVAGTRGGRENNEEWSGVKDHLDASQARILHLQEPDGAFPGTLMFNTDSPGMNLSEENAKIYSTGHHLEWLITRGEIRQLEVPAIQRALFFLSEVLIRRQFDPGPASVWFHAVHALRLYKERAKAVRIR